MMPPMPPLLLVPLVASLLQSPALRAPATSPVCTPAVGGQQPVIDVHMHAVANGLDKVIAELDANNVIAVVVSSLRFPLTQEWAARDARFLPSLAFRDASMPLATARDLLQRHVVHGLGELGFQYAGLRPDDPSLDQYFTLAEELDVPVAIHMAGGGLQNEPAFRVRLGDPLLLEEILIRHPTLRVNIMHAGLPFLEGTLAILRRYPQVYADLSKISDPDAYPREQFHEYLQSLMRARLGERLMFGSDAAGSGALGPSIEGITSAGFLTMPQQRGILCENAARFLRLSGRPHR